MLTASPAGLFIGVQLYYQVWILKMSVGFQKTNNQSKNKAKNNEKNTALLNVGLNMQQARGRLAGRGQNHNLHALNVVSFPAQITGPLLLPTLLHLET